MGGSTYVTCTAAVVFRSSAKFCEQCGAALQRSYDSYPAKLLVTGAGTLQCNGIYVLNKSNKPPLWWWRLGGKKRQRESDYEWRIRRDIRQKQRDYVWQKFTGGRLYYETIFPPHTACQYCRISPERYAAAIRNATDLYSPIPELITSFLPCEVCDGTKRSSRHMVIYYNQTDSSWEIRSGDGKRLYYCGPGNPDPNKSFRACKQPDPEFPRWNKILCRGKFPPPTVAKALCSDCSFKTENGIDTAPGCPECRLLLKRASSRFRRRMLQVPPCFLPFAAPVGNIEKQGSEFRH